MRQKLSYPLLVNSLFKMADKHNSQRLSRIQTRTNIGFPVLSQTFKMAESAQLKSNRKSSKMSRPGVMTYEKTKELISLSDKDYIPPELPFKRVEFDQEIKFGSDQMREQFCIDFSNWTFINHGAFGGALSAAIATVNQIQLHSESQPLRFVDRELLPNMVYVIRRLAGFISCDPRDLVLVSNATEAIATVVKSLKLGSRDKVYYLNTRYYAVNKLMMFLKEDIGKTNVIRTW